MKYLVKPLLVFILACAPFQAFAAADTNADLLKACANTAKGVNFEPKDFGESFQSGYCLGMVQGIVYGTSVSKRPFCLPESWTVGQGVDEFVKWANSHADKMDEMAAVGVMASHIIAFPCAKAK